MDLLYPRCAGIDVHKRTAVVTIGWSDEQGQRQKRTRTFGTMTGEIEQLATWLVEHDILWPLMDNDWARAHGLSVTRDHDGLGPITTIGPSPRLSRTPPEAGRPAPRPGSDAAAILESVGRAGDLDRLVSEGVVVTEGISAR